MSKAQRPRETLDHGPRTADAVPVLDLVRQYHSIEPEIDAAVHAVLESGEFILGPHVERFESAAAEYCRARHAIGLASGTDALLLSLKALGIGPGDGVLVPSFTFFATAGVVHNVGATPIFCDIDPRTFNIDPASARAVLEARRGPRPNSTNSKNPTNSKNVVSSTPNSGLRTTDHGLRTPDHGPRPPASPIRAIIPVHLYGQMADMTEIMELADEHRLAVIEDAAQAIGATYSGSHPGDRQPRTPDPGLRTPDSGPRTPDPGLRTTDSGPRTPASGSALLAAGLNEPYEPNELNEPNECSRRAGTIGAVGCFSFYPTKNLGAYGDAGMVTTDDDVLAEGIRLLRVHGAKPKYVHHVVGINSRLDALQAAILSVKLKHLDDWARARVALADRYDALLADLPDIRTPYRAPGRTHVFHQYTIRVGRGKRDALVAHLKREGIGTMIYYPGPLHLQACFAHIGHCAGDFPESESASAEVLSLPMFPELSPGEQDRVVETIREFVSRV